MTISPRPLDMIMIPTPTTPELEGFLSDTIQSSNQLDYVLWVCSTFLDGSIPNDLLTFIIGSGGNGKSMFMNLMNVALGELCSTVPSTLFTKQDSDSNIPRPDLIALKSKRFGYITEPDQGILNSEIVKKLCGSDWISCRTLYKEPITFQFRTKFCVACNEIPEISGEEAIWRRIRIIKFKTSFIEIPARSSDRRMNPKLNTIIHSDIKWRQSFMNRLIGYLGQTREIPGEFQCAYNHYKDMSSDFMGFLTNNIIPSPGSCVRLQKILDAYYEGNMENIPNSRTREYKKIFNQTHQFVEKLIETTKDISVSYGPCLVKR